MRSDTQPLLEAFFRSLTQASQSLLLLDYDGTLAPFRKERDQAVPYPGVASALQAIMGEGHTRVVIISGREAADIRPLLGIQPSPEVWGLHGLQRVKPDGSSEILQPDERTLEVLLAAGEWLDHQHLRHMAEFKTGSIAFHWRGLGECEAEEVRGRVLAGWLVIAERAGLDLLEFDGGVEVRASQADKGDAVRAILREMEANTPAAYLGDDTTDESAFQALQGRGLSVLVRPRWRQTAAQLWLKPPDELLSFLARWLRACRAGAASGKTAAAVKR
ncbi:MAG: trehalose-phosphatase [Acidobacteriia bacterium]|nr:trehalose-phosphatase [Terriglobia bacterium]